MKKKLAGLSASLMLGLFAVVGFTPAAQAYPEVVINLTVDHQVRFEGQKFTATATSNVSCDWTLEWNGDSRSKGAGKKFVTTFTAPHVTQLTKIPLHGTCHYLLPDGATPVTGPGRRLAGPPETWRQTIVITVLPRGGSVSPPTGNLPNTGGPDLWLLLGGFGLVVGGGAAIARSRRARAL